MQTNFETDWTENRIDMNTSVETFHLKENEIPCDRLRVYQAIPNDGITCRELSKRWGCTPNEISGRFTELHQQGHIIADGKRYLPNSKGRMYPHTVWKKSTNILGAGIF